MGDGDTGSQAAPIKWLQSSQHRLKLARTTPVHRLHRLWRPFTGLTGSLGPTLRLEEAGVRTTNLTSPRLP